MQTLQNMIHKIDLVHDLERRSASKEHITYS